MQGKLVEATVSSSHAIKQTEAGRKSDLLERFPDISFPFRMFLALAPAMRMHTYPIASAPPRAAGEGVPPFSLTFSVLDKPAWSNPRILFLRIASNYPADLAS
ncbi:hypothetical protein DL767_000135 [Monosporascus sp. MG133]|nr:hypothetical protein DL767_000135 [Monosporascus sp. MG133]